ncbi:methionine ABC transporter substrate-binding lipoprotein MetQ [Bacillus cereus]|uniref:Lipoprotein n=1 Tax=Bacillus cereus TaxID=1396 RepID=A0A2A7HX83_BACCE|nr:methionine ABC transporter substrate-binding lipoprotein MetQ [Bacillus cereus]MDM5236620.1 methionine ABC transporter substrate-binding lipoprotein MetQ [Bacillus cereus]PEC21591.1 methionine ABC transporter substrate-binding protein [Bacillus cereus]PGZ09897.1 methionine ABC transporter substrate-binding protein [Bacillus cereus]
MKKIILSVVTALSVFTLAACGGKDENKLVVGASNVPHAVILEKAQPILEKKGIKLEIKKFQDYVLPNKALADKEIDANYFQHIPYLDKEIQEKGYKIVNAGKIHLEPMGIYSKKYKSLKDLPDGGTVIMSNNVAERGRMLALLQKGDVIKLKDGVDVVKATVKDVVENPKNLKFKTDVEPGLSPKLYENNEGDALFINSNYAIDAKLNPTKDAIAIEGSDSPYANIIAVRKGDEKKKEIKELVEVLHSKEIQDFINKEYKGAVLPVSE